jgi:DNA-binding CsgD family transcriptional regulator
MKKVLLHSLNKREHAELMILSHKLLSCEEKNDFASLVLGLKKLFNHDNAVLAYGNIKEILSNPKPKVDLFNISFPQSLLDYYFENRYHTSDASFFEYLKHLRPVHWATLYKKVECKGEAAIKGLDYNVRHGWTYGTLNPSLMNCCIVHLAGLRTKNSQRNRVILEYIIPFLSEAYRHILNRYGGPVSELTHREIEVLNWIKDGKSSWDISMILTCSKRVVDFHVTNIKRKLNAVSRAQAVAIGLHQGIIRF